MPAQSGVRILFVTGTGVTGTAGADPHAGRAAPAEPVAAPPALAAPAIASERGATAVRATVVSVTILAFAVIGVQQWRKRRTL